MQAGLAFEGEREHCSLLYYMNDKNDIYRQDYNDPSDEDEVINTLRGKKLFKNLHHHQTICVSQ